MSLATLQRRLAYTFKNEALLKQALTHRSHGVPHNERLEFLGDSILNFSVAAILYARLTQVPEGDLSRIRSNLVKQQALADIATQLQLSDELRMGQGELKSGGFKRPSILADAVEAIIAAVYLDGGMDAAQALVDHLYEPLLKDVDFSTLGKDAKTLLQELVQAQKWPLPQYVVLDTKGAAHELHFEVSCTITTIGVQTFAGSSTRRGAEQEAAMQAYRKVQDYLRDSGVRVPKGLSMPKAGGASKATGAKGASKASKASGAKTAKSPSKAGGASKGGK